MTRIKRDPRASILDNRRLVADCLVAIFPGNGGDFGASADDDRLSGTARADLAWMADMVTQIDRGTTPTDKDARAFASAAYRVLGVLAAIERRSCSARLERLCVRTMQIAMLVGGVGLLVAGALFVSMFSIGPPTPAGYDSVMTGSLQLGLGGMLGMFIVMMARWLVFAAARGMQWACRHPLRAAVWIIGMALIGLITYVASGVVGLASIGLIGAALVLRPRSADTSALGSTKAARRSVLLPDYDPRVSIHDPRVTENGAVHKGHADIVHLF